MSDFFRMYIRKQNLTNAPKIKYRTNFSNCVPTAMNRRGFERTQGDDWDIIWSEKDNINELYEKRLQPSQKINHFRNYYELCRKDLLIRNLKKYKKTLERESKPQEAAQYNFFPQTYVLPSQYVIFADEFKRQNNSDGKNVWIMKPTGRSQGKGIFLFNRLTQVSQWESHSAEPYIVQKYIADPLLIGAKKFDIRLYVLVTSFSPLTVYLYRGGFARFTHCRYDQNKIQQSEMHLTNVAIQKNAEGYDDTVGGKWFIDKLKSYLLSKYGEADINVCFTKIQQIIVKTLEALQKVMSTDKPNSFELYGFDVLLDSALKPWLIEVNGSPSMTANTDKDYQFKMNVLDDTLNVIDLEKYMTGNEEQIGGFDLICKGKTNKGCHFYLEKMSFLGTLNNRLDNLKKIAKNNSIKINQKYQEKEQKNGKRQLVSANYSNCSSTIQSSKRINGTRRSNINTNKNGKEFVIKQKSKREITNENEYKEKW